MQEVTEAPEQEVVNTSEQAAAKKEPSESVTDENIDDVQASDEDAEGTSDEPEDNQEENDTPISRKEYEKLQKRQEQTAKNAERRIAQLTYEMKEMERQYREQANGSSPKAEDHEPSEDDFDTYDEYQEALVEHRTNKRIAEKEAEAQQKQMQEKQSKLIEQRRSVFQEAETQFRAETPDYDEKATEFGELVQDVTRKYGVSNQGIIKNEGLETVGAMIMDSANAPALIHHLGTKGDLSDFENMSRTQAARAIFQLEQQLANKPKPERKPVPAPSKPLKGSGRLSNTAAPENPEDFMKWRNKQLKNKKG